jgi:hypothetical protein
MIDGKKLAAIAAVAVVAAGGVGGGLALGAGGEKSGQAMKHEKAKKSGAAMKGEKKSRAAMKHEAGAAMHDATSTAASFTG